MAVNSACRRPVASDAASTDESRHDNRELLAPVTTRDVGRTKCRLHAVRKGLDDLVADMMSVRVVDGLEMAE